MSYLIVLLMMIIIYFYVLKKKHPLINLLFFQLAGTGFMVLLPNIIYLIKKGFFFKFCLGDFYQLFYFFLLFVFTALLELDVINFKINIPKFKNINISKKIIYLMVGIILIYCFLNYQEIIIAFSNPRMFYASTRLGGGIIYYVILPLIIFLYYYYITHSCKKNAIKCIISTIIVCFIIYIFGQKALLLTIGYLCLSTITFKYNQKNNRFIFKIGLCFLFMGIIVFSLYSKQQGINGNNVLNKIVAYSDYIRNFNDLVVDLDEFKYGKIFLQDEFYSYIPRLIWKDKPELFGSLTLGLEVPRLVGWTLAKTGAPSFGVIGAAYADFGFVGIFLKLILSCIFLFIARKYEILVNQEYNFWHHILFLTFASVKIFSITLVTFPLYQLLVIFILYKLSLKRGGAS